PLQVKAGIRVAELTSKLNIVTNGTVTLGGLPPNPFGITSLSYLYDVRNKQNTSFRGAGPRVGFEGAVPLGGGWQVDYLADAAGCGPPPAGSTRRSYHRLPPRRSSCLARMPVSLRPATSMALSFRISMPSSGCRTGSIPA